MPNTPRKSRKQTPRRGFQPVGDTRLSRQEKREEERHSEIVKIQERFVKVNERISLATLIYAIAAVVMILWSVIAFFLGQMYF